MTGISDPGDSYRNLSRIVYQLCVMQSAGLKKKAVTTTISSTGDLRHGMSPRG
jgi:hypothetical protein